MSAATTVKSGWDKVRAAAEAAWRDFRKRSKYFQYKAYIGAAYTALVVATIIIVVPRSPSNRLKAYVLAARADFVVGSYVLVRNDSRRDWDEVILTLNDTHVYRPRLIKAGDKVRVDLKSFTAPGKPALTESEVRLLEISTSRGSEKYTLSFLAN